MSAQPAPRPPAKSSRPDMVNGPIATTLLTFALPVLGSHVLQSLNASINAIWGGHYLGEPTMAAVDNKV